MTKLEKIKKQLHKLNRIEGKHISLFVFYDSEYEDYIFIDDIGEQEIFEFENLNDVRFCGFYTNTYGKEYDAHIFDLDDDNLKEKIDKFMEQDFFMKDIKKIAWADVGKEADLLDPDVRYDLFFDINDHDNGIEKRYFFLKHNDKKTIKEVEDNLFWKKYMLCGYRHLFVENKIIHFNRKLYRAG